MIYHNRVKIFVYLYSDIDAFNITDYISFMIHKRFPSAQVVEFDSFSKMAERIEEPEIIVTWLFSKELYSKASNLKYIFTPAAGKDWVPDDPNGVVQIQFGSFHGPIIAESLLGTILQFNQMKHLMQLEQQKKEWNRNLQSHTKMLKNQTIFIIGYGKIGKECARLFTLLGAQVIGLKRTIDSEWDELGVRCITEDSIALSLKSADHVVLILPSGDSTDNFFKKDYFKTMKKSAFLYNIGRGNSIKNENLIWALENHVISGAAIDVFEEEPLSKDSPLWEVPNLIITPHSICICQNYKSEYFIELEREMKNII